MSPTEQCWPALAHPLHPTRSTSIYSVCDTTSAHPCRKLTIQHSAGSGKSNSIAWLSHQLIGVKRYDKEVFDSVIVVTDRRILDDQIQKTIKQFMQVGATVGHAEHSGDLRKFIEEGKKIIVSTVQKFPFVLDEIATVWVMNFRTTLRRSPACGRLHPPAQLQRAAVGNAARARHHAQRSLSTSPEAAPRFTYASEMLSARFSSLRQSPST